MYGLRIVDPTRWNPSWSARIGETLRILNSTYNLFVFDEDTGPNDIREAVADIPPRAYDLIKLHPSTTGVCEIQTDDGQCFELDS